MGFNKLAEQEKLDADDYKFHADKARTFKWIVLATSVIPASVTVLFGNKYDFWEQAFSPTPNLSDISPEAWLPVGIGTLLTLLSWGMAAKFQYYESAIRKNEKKARKGQKTAEDAAAILSLRR